MILLSVLSNAVKCVSNLVIQSNELQTRVIIILLYFIIIFFNTYKFFC